MNRTQEKVDRKHVKEGRGKWGRTGRTRERGEIGERRY